MEVITGVAPAEYGDKSSLVVHIVTKSGLDQPKPTGSASFGYGSFKSPTGRGQHRRRERTRLAIFCPFSGMRTDRFLDPPEFEALHDAGHSHVVLRPVDVHPSDRDTFHLNMQVGRSSFDVPNTYDQHDAGQDQHQTITTFNIAPGYSRA